MSYAITDIIEWAKISQPLAVIDQSKKIANQSGTTVSDLDIKLYIERKSLEYSYNQDPSTNETFQIGQWVLALIGIYLFPSQDATGGGTIVPVIPTGAFAYPLILTVSNFQSDGITFIDNDMPSNDKLTMFVANYSQEWFIESSGLFTRTSSGFVIVADSFNISNFPFIIVEKYVTP